MPDEFLDAQRHDHLIVNRPSSRHPNYFGELAFWWGLMLFGLAAALEHWAWIIPGAIAMTLMFVFVSIPFMDERSVQRRPAYAEHMKRVSALLPLPPRN